MDSHGLLPLLCILRNNCTKAVVPLLTKFSKHQSTRLNHASKLYMERRHCISDTIVKESALKKYFTFVYVYAVSLLLIQSAPSSRYAVKLFHRHPSITASKIYIYHSCKLLGPRSISISRLYVLALSAFTKCGL